MSMSIGPISTYMAILVDIAWTNGKVCREPSGELVKKWWKMVVEEVVTARENTTR